MGPPAISRPSGRPNLGAGGTWKTALYGKIISGKLISHIPSVFDTCIWYSFDTDTDQLQIQFIYGISVSNEYHLYICICNQTNIKCISPWIENELYHWNTRKVQSIHLSCANARLGMPIKAPPVASLNTCRRCSSDKKKWSFWSVTSRKKIYLTISYDSLKLYIMIFETLTQISM